MRGPAFALSVLLAVAGCAADLPPAPATAVVDARDAKPRLWYLGLGMYGETWSENDVADLMPELQHGATGFRVIPTVFSNRFEGMPQRYPAVDSRPVEAMIADIAAGARPGDVVMIYVSTHGAPGLLGRSAGGEELTPVDVAEFQRWLEQLGDHDTVLVLSACFSGSFIPALKGPHRIIFAAARADRTSFGCQAGAEHTVFGDALLRALARPGESLRAVVADTRSVVSERERDLQVDLPSQPQISVGAAVAQLYAAPLF